jgi:thioredoxin-related protein
MRRILLSVIIAVSLFISACSVLMPYEEDFACKVPTGVGMCGSISDVYKETSR